MPAPTSTRACHPRDIPDWFISHGRYWATVADIAEVLGIPSNQVYPIVAQLRSKSKIFSPARGLYVFVPPEFRKWSVLPASYFIDPLMNHLGHPYYVGLLSAAELHGSAHQRPQVFQVITSARKEDKTIERVRLEFFTDANMGERPTEVRNTPTGILRLSSPEVTILDLVANPIRGGGLSNVATVIAEMLRDEVVESSSLASPARTYALSVVRRTGWLIEQMSQALGLVVPELDQLHDLSRAHPEPSILFSGEPRAGLLDHRWHIILNGEIEADL